MGMNEEARVKCPIHRMDLVWTANIKRHDVYKCPVEGCNFRPIFRYVG